MDLELDELVARVARFELAGVIPDLTVADRCDGCGAPAGVRTIMSFDEVSGVVSELLFCSVHWAVHQDRVMEGALLFQDDRGLSD